MPLRRLAQVSSSNWAKISQCLSCNGCSFDSDIWSMMLVYHSLLFIQCYLTVIYNYLHTFWIETNFGKPFSLVREKSRWSYIAERFVKTSWTVVRPFKEYLFLSNHIWQSAMFFVCFLFFFIILATKKIIYDYHSKVE